jgi:hypothetical protein
MNHHREIHAQLYEAALVDVSDVAEEIGRRQGGWHDYAKVNSVASRRWIAVPQCIMFARSLQGTAPEDAVKWAAAALRKIYGD